MAVLLSVCAELYCKAASALRTRGLSAGKRCLSMTVRIRVLRSRRSELTCNQSCLASNVHSHQGFAN